ncbi:hypothetical protein EMILIAHAH_18 [Bacillus phage vB_BanH_Emiliahah]|nr:hypothetical protein EMILIAHAH_18 [Bacillus phage vB_BanH_Emiliahah]
MQRCFGHSRNEEELIVLGKQPNGSDITMYFKKDDGTMVKVGGIETVVAYSGKGKSRLPVFETMYGGSISCSNVEFKLNETGKKLVELGLKEEEAWTVSTFYGEEGYKNVKKLIKMGFSPRAAYNIQRNKGTSWKEGKHGK